MGGAAFDMLIGVGRQILISGAIDGREAKGKNKPASGLHGSSSLCSYR